MKHFTYFLILFFTISFFSCKKEREFILSDNEALFIEKLKFNFQAEDVKVKRVIRLDTIVENSIEINIFNSSAIEYDNPEVKNYCDNIFIEFVKTIYKEKRYNYIEISFSKGKDFAFYHKWKGNGKHYNEIAIQNVINQLTDPQYIFEQTILRYEFQEKYDSLLIFCREFLETDPNDNIALKHCGIAYYYLNELDSAILYLKNGRSIYPNDIDLPMNLAIAYGDKKDYEIAFYGVSSQYP